MEFNSQICTTEIQSKLLLALGLKKETADCAHCYTTEEHGEYKFWDIVISDWESYCDVDDENIPAWSLHRLIVLSGMSIIESTTDNLYDKVIQYIEYLINCGNFNKEYLE